MGFPLIRWLIQVDVSSSLYQLQEGRKGDVSLSAKRTLLRFDERPDRLTGSNNRPIYMQLQTDSSSMYYT